jgi:hypothetical protein
MTAAVVVGSSSCSNSSSSRRLLTSVAIIGRENEPIYLLGDLWDGDNDSTVASPTKTIAAAAAATEDHNVDATTSTKSMKVATHPKIDNDDGETDQIASVSPPTTNNSPPKGRGLFGRIMKKNNDDASNITSSSITTTNIHQQQQQQQQLNDNIHDDGDDDDPFGFFESSYSNPHHRQQHRMSLTQQLVVHASLDVFEEKASSSRTMYSGKNFSGGGGRGSASGSGVRWRTPGTDSATSMYIGLLCRVEERWSVYGEFYCFVILCMHRIFDPTLSFFHHCRSSYPTSLLL